MADEIKVEVNSKDVEEKLRVVLPTITTAHVEQGMRKVVGDLYEKAMDNIETMFIHDKSKSRKMNLESSILGTVKKEGDLIIGTVGADLAAAPYARILELGGVIPAHVIRPKNASHLAIPTATMHYPWEPDDSYMVRGDYLVSKRGRALMVNDIVLLEEVTHPGAKIAPYYYLNKALIELATRFENDIEAAVAAGIAASGMNEEAPR